MKNSKQSLDDLQEASIKAGGEKPPQLPQIVQIRRYLHHYWGEIATFMQEEGFQTANQVVCLQDMKGPAELIIALEELKTKVEECSVKAKALVAQHDEFIRFFGQRNIPFHGSDPIITSFTEACGALRAALIDLLGLIENQCEACAAYQTTAHTNYTPAMLEELIVFGKEWNPYVAKAKQTHAHLKKLSEYIIAPGVKQPTPLEGSEVCCIIM